MKTLQRISTWISALAFGLSASCALAATTTGSLSVLATLDPAPQLCTGVSAPGALNFGAITSPPSGGSVIAPTAEATIQVLCDAGVSYEIDLDLGLNPYNETGVNVVRYMKESGGTASVAYYLYSNPSRTEPWGHNLTDGYTVSATMDGTGSATHIVYARAYVYPDTVTATTALSDTVTITLTY